MPPDSLAGFLTKVRTDVEAAFPSASHPPTRLSLEALFTIRSVRGQGLVLRPLTEADAGRKPARPTHRLVLEWAPDPTATEPRVRTREPEGSAFAKAPAPAVPVDPASPVSGGDPATLTRRLGMVLGGPPGFGTGARAEILADLLGEFGRPALLEALRSDWISQFDTDPDSSLSVTRPGPEPGA
jgi:hypothetical protein